MFRAILFFSDCSPEFLRATAPQFLTRRVMDGALVISLESRAFYVAEIRDANRSFLGCEGRSAILKLRNSLFYC